MRAAILRVFTHGASSKSTVWGVVCKIFTVLLSSSSIGQNLVPEQKVEIEEDHEKRRASPGAQPQLQRPHGVQLSTVAGRVGHAGPLQAAQPAAAAAAEHHRHAV